MTIDEYVSLLKNSKNLILTGAPGTGKTYLAKQIVAKWMLDEDYSEEIEDDPVFRSRCRFVQFHPSYDYTDFVEGLRPNSNMEFPREDGTFKSFCRDVVKNKREKEQVTSDLRKMLEDKDLRNKIPISEDKYYKCTYTLNGDDITITNTDGKGSDTISVDEMVRIILERPQRIEDVERLHPEWSKGNNKGIFRTYGLNLSRFYYENLEYPYFFIIDEINRGELSKIFGELFFSIDPGYRGVKGRINTQYQTLVPKDDPFYDGFYVPKNVYIIGTMNDIDRGVESMDFAIRRRFTWCEVTAEERIDDILSGCKWKDDATKRMKALNNALKEQIKLSRAYEIGPAYYLKLDQYNGDFESLWKYHLKPVLSEYLRGRSEEKKEQDLEELKKAYDGAE